MFGLFGFVGQHVYNVAFDKTAPASAPAGEAKGNLFQRLANKKWTPFTVLTDQEYKAMLDEKLLRFEAEIALIDDRIAGLRVKEREWAENELKAQVQSVEKTV